jgi:hypothetical protein
MRKLQELTSLILSLSSKEFQRKDLNYKSLQAFPYSSVPKNFETKNRKLQELQNSMLKVKFSLDSTG